MLRRNGVRARVSERASERNGDDEMHERGDGDQRSAEDLNAYLPSKAYARDVFQPADRCS